MTVFWLVDMFQALGQLIEMEGIMYRRLEPKPLKIEANENGDKAKCTCHCKVSQPKEGQPKPEGSLAGTEIAVHYDISG